MKVEISKPIALTSQRCLRLTQQEESSCYVES